MGATNQIKETNISLQLDNKKCPQCQQLFTQQEIDDQNFDIWFDASNDVVLEPNIPHRGYMFSIWIRSIEHETCPDPIEERETSKETKEITDKKF